MKKTALLLACVFSAAFCTPAYAINWVPLLHNTPAERFTEDDMRMFAASVNKALGETADGQTVSWENPATKARGSIVVEQTGTRDGLICKNIRITNEARNRKATQVLTLCQEKSGEWTFAHPATKK